MKLSDKEQGQGQREAHSTHSTHASMGPRQHRVQLTMGSVILAVRVAHAVTARLIVIIHLGGQAQGGVHLMVSYKLVWLLGCCLGEDLAGLVPSTGESSKNTGNLRDQYI